MGDGVAPSPGALDGILVADFSRVLAGPLATMLLADLGAEVVKIERPGVGDDTRAWGPPYADDGTSTYYLSVNRNKRSVVLDLRDPDDLEAARSLAIEADVVVENFRDGTMDGFGLGYEALSAENPGVVFCRISGFGSGAGRTRPGYDFVVQAASGLMSIGGPDDGPATKTGVAIVDVLTGQYATIGILAALHERAASGRGQYVEVDLLSSALSSLVNQASGFLNAGVVPTRMGNRHPSIAPYETLRTATSDLALAVGNDAQFRRLCDALGAPHLADDERWTTNAARVEHREALVRELEHHLGARPCDDWVDLLDAADVPCSRVNTIEEAFGLAERLELDAIREIQRNDGLVVRTPSNPITLSRTPATYRTAPPGLGADGDRAAVARSIDVHRDATRAS